MSRFPRRCVFGRIEEGRVVGRQADGVVVSLPPRRGESLLISRTDCDLISLALPRLSRRRLKRRVAEELPRVYPGALAGHVCDTIVQAAGRQDTVLVAVMSETVLSTYEAAAGGAALSLFPLLFAADRRSSNPATPRSDSYRVRRGALSHGRAGRRNHADRGRAVQVQFLLREGPALEQVTLQGRTVVDSYLIPPFTSGDGPDPEGHADWVVSAPSSNGARCGAFSAYVPPGRIPALPSLFDEHRGVHRWMRSPFLSPLFLALALPLLLAADLKAFSLLSRRAGEVSRLEQEVRSVNAAVAAHTASAKYVRELESRLRNGTAGRQPDPYLLLSELRRTVGTAVSVTQVALSGNTAILDLRALDPLATAERIEKSAAVAATELIEAGERAADGRVSATLRVVCR